MASPISLYVVPNCGLELANGKLEELEKDFTCNRNKKAQTKYFIRNTCEFPLATTRKDYEGWLSPLNDVTLPRAIRRVAGVPDTARYFAFLYPPSGLAENIDWD